MSKSKMSVVVILSTIIAVTAMLKPELFTAQGFKAAKLSMINDIKKVNVLSKADKEARNQKVTYNEVVQSSEIRVKDINTGKGDIQQKNSDNKGSSDRNILSSKGSGIVLTEAAKKSKLEALHNSQLEDIKNYYDDKYAQKDNSKKEIDNKVSKENTAKSKENETKDDIANKNDIAKNNDDKSDTSVFKVSKEEIKDKLTLSDKQKILSVARKLSPSDYEKINQYISKEGDEQGVVDAAKLLRDRLSDKDYDKIKEVVSKFLNMDVVEKK